MSKFDGLYRAAEALEGDKLIERKVRGYPVLSEAVKGFMKAVHGFHMANPEFGLGDYFGILEQNGFLGDGGRLFDADAVAAMDEQCIMAMLVYFTRAFRHSGNTMIVDCIRDGVVGRAIERLKALDGE